MSIVAHVGVMAVARPFDSESVKIKESSFDTECALGLPTPTSNRRPPTKKPGCLRAFCEAREPPGATAVAECTMVGRSTAHGCCWPNVPKFMGFYLVPMRGKNVLRRASR